MSINSRFYRYRSAKLDKMAPPSTAQAAKKTLDRILSRAGVGSRTEARRWIANGRVAVNGKTIRSADAWADPARDRIT